VPGAEVGDREGPKGDTWLTLRADVAAVVGAANVDENAAELACEAAELAELVIPDAAIRGPVLLAAAADLAGCWPLPADPLWAVMAVHFMRTRTGWGKPGPTLPDAARRYLPALALAVPAYDRDELGGIVGEGPLAPILVGGALLVAREGGRLTIPGLALGVLYRFERAELWRSRATFAAGEAFEAVRALGGAENPQAAHFAAVEHALGTAAADDDETDDTVADDARADVARRSTFAGELLAAAGKVARELFEGEPPGDEAAARATVDTPHGPALRWDAAFADMLASIGTRGHRLAEEGRKKAAERMAAARGEAFGGQAVLPGTPRPAAGELWGLWFELDAAAGDPPRWLARLARALWADVWRPRVLFESAKRAPALPLLVRRSFVQLRQGAELRDGTAGGFEYRALDGTVVARFRAPALNRKQLDAMRRGVEHLRGVLFEAVIRGLVRDAFRQGAAGINPFNRLVYPHGFEGFAASHGINSQYRAKLPELFEAMAAYRGADRTLPPLISGWWTTPATRGRPAELRTDVGEALATGYASVVKHMADTVTGDALLLPVLPLPLLAIPGASRADFAALCDLQWELLTLFRARAEEGRDLGGWLLAAADMRAVADRAALRSSLAAAWREPWTKGDGAWLRELPDGRLALADHGATELLREAADKSTEARERAKRGKAKRS
jgi:hypothetical protein